MEWACKGGCAEEDLQHTRVTVPQKHAAIVAAGGHCAVVRAHKCNVLDGLLAEEAPVPHHIALRAQAAPKLIIQQMLNKVFRSALCKCNMCMQV